ncbi:MAG: recombinase family protein [Chloroflexi bacterium]|nr:recombinase family protein [Chloroflexota bacterium]
MISQYDAGYVRVSTDMQMERDALQNQIQALESHAVAHSLNLRLYKDEGVSAKDTDRPALQRLIADVQACRVRSVLVTKLDRISRSLVDLLDLMRLFEQHGVKFISVRDNLDTSGPVGRFMLHILGAIAELERGITAERVAEDMKVRAKRGKWNGGLTPYGRRMEDGQLRIVPEEATILRRMRELLLQTRTWRGVAVALNRSGLRTRGWEPLERDGRVVRKGHAAEEWTPTSVKRVLLQPINAGTRVYNRRRAKGRTSAPRPADEHVVVEDFWEPIFSRAERDHVLRVAAEIESTPPRRAASPHLLSGLVECTCGTKMYGIHNYVTTKRGRYRLGYYRCRRASSKGTCAAKQVPAAVVERAVIDELRRLGFDHERVAALAGAAQATFEAVLQPLVERRGQTAADLERVGSRLDSLLELAEDRLVGKQEFATFPRGVSATRSENYGVRECTDAHAFANTIVGREPDRDGHRAVHRPEELRARYPAARGARRSTLPRDAVPAAAAPLNPSKAWFWQARRTGGSLSRGSRVAGRPRAMPPLTTVAALPPRCRDRRRLR